MSLAAQSRSTVSSILRFFEITHNDTPQSDPSARAISPSQRPLPDNTQHSQQTSMPPAGFEPTIFSRPAAADLRLRPRGHWDRQLRQFSPHYFENFRQSNMCNCAKMANTKVYSTSPSKGISPPHPASKTKFKGLFFLNNTSSKCRLEEHAWSRLTFKFPWMLFFFP